MLTLLAFLFTIIVLVTVHEYGHYQAARWFNVKILTFSIGFGKPLLTWQRGETTWQIAMIPLGGFVRMLGEGDAQDVPEAEMARSFSRLSPLRRIIIVAAGPVANLLLAWVLFAAVWMIGIESLKPVVAEVDSGSVAAQAGFNRGDEILRFDGQPVTDWDGLRLAALEQVGKVVPVQVRDTTTGKERALRLNLATIQSKQMDADIVEHIGLSPVRLLNKIGSVDPNGAAVKGGMRVGDEILRINGLALQHWNDLHALVQANPGKPLQFLVQRGGKQIALQLVPREVMDKGRKIGRIGVGPMWDMQQLAAQKFILKLGPIDALERGADKGWRMTRMTLQMIGRMFTGSVSSSNVSGPIGVATMAGQSAEMGMPVFLQFLAFVSLSLGILNLLPVPVLDGGHLLYHSIELVRGRPLPESWQTVGQRIGLALLLGLMLLALYNDIYRFIPGLG